MEVRFIGKRTPVECRKDEWFIDCREGKIYVVISIENEWYRIVDESGEDYLYPPTVFEIVGGSDADIDPQDPVFNRSPNGDKKNDDAAPPGAVLYREACKLIDLTGQGKTGDYQKGARLLREAAELGHTDAMNILGMLYCYGYGVKKDNTQAIKWIRKSAAYGNPCAYLNLANMYEIGIGVPCDRKIAFDMYLAMAKSGSPDGMKAVGTMLYNGVNGEPDYNEAFRWYSQAAEWGEAGALDGVGWCYYNGNGVQQDYKKALEYFAMGAEKGNAYAAIHISRLYYHGKGVRQDYEQALCWAKEAAHQGLGVAMFDIAELHEEGKGVTKDIGIASVWYRRALSARYMEAQKSLERLQHYNKRAICPLSGEEIDDKLCQEINYRILPEWDILQSADIEVQKDIFSEYPSITDWNEAKNTCPDCPASYLNKTKCMVLCPCCGEGYVEFGHSFDICNVCDWEDDFAQFDDPHFAHGANKPSLAQARKAYKKGIRFPHSQIRGIQIEKAMKLMEKKHEALMPKMYQVWY